MSSAPAPGPQLARGQLASRTVRTLSRGGWANPDVLLVRAGSGYTVVKDYAPRRAWVRSTIGRWLQRREQRAYRILRGLPAVPRYLGRIDVHAFALEYRPGERLSREIARRTPETFLAELREAVGAMHARGVVHLDLRHRSNILAGDDGHPVLIDFASALCFRPAGPWPRWLQPCLAWIDRRALGKWASRWAQEPSPGGAASAADAFSTPASDASRETTSAGSRGASRPM